MPGLCCSILEYLELSPLTISVRIVLNPTVSTVSHLVVEHEYSEALQVGILLTRDGVIGVMNTSHEKSPDRQRFESECFYWQGLHSASIDYLLFVYPPLLGSSPLCLPSTPSSRSSTTKRPFSTISENRMQRQHYSMKPRRSSTISKKHWHYPRVQRARKTVKRSEKGSC